MSFDTLVYRRIGDMGSLPPDLEREVCKLEHLFTVDAVKLKQIVTRFKEELQQGLEREGQNISMNITWVLGWPTGDEKGQYLTLDLGGTNLRTCLIDLKGGSSSPGITQESYRLPGDLKTGSAEALWDFVAGSLEKFIKDYKLEGTAERPIPFGFTFSYPAKQKWIDHGTLVTWTKGFDIKGVEGEDAAGQLREAMAQRNLPIELVALINDTTGAMIASAYTDNNVIAGAIFGTGCNAAYMEDCGSIPKLEADMPADRPMAINCEYGAFDNSLAVLPRTKYDDQIDRESPRPGEQSFEKMSAGLYLGEIFRLVLVDLHTRGHIFKDQDIKDLKEGYSLDTGFLSAIEEDCSPQLSETQNRFRDVFGIQVVKPELVLMQRLAIAISVRGARLCTCGIAAICQKKGIESGHVAADGSVANKHPMFKQRWANAMGEVLDWPKDRKTDPIVITSAVDGSGIGAAVIAAMTQARAQKGDNAGIRQR